MCVTSVCIALYSSGEVLTNGMAPLGKLRVLGEGETWMSALMRRDAPYGYKYKRICSYAGTYVQ